MTQTASAAVPAKVQDKKSAAEKMPAVPTVGTPEAKTTGKEPATPAPFTDPEQFREAIQPAAPISERLERLEFLNSLCNQRD